MDRAKQKAVLERNTLDTGKGIDPKHTAGPTRLHTVCCYKAAKCEHIFNIFTRQFTEYWRSVVY